MAETCLAYIDPGAGSILLQLLAGTIIGVGLFFRQSIVRIVRSFRRGGGSSGPSVPEPADDLSAR